MKELTNALCVGLMAAVSWPWSGQAQTPGAAVLKIDIANYVPYSYDLVDTQKFASAPVLTPAAGPGGARAFIFFVFIGDIVAVNGKAAKGLWTARGTTMSFEPNAA